MDYYEILQVKKTASQDEIKQSYKKLVMKNHPDKGGSKEEFQKIQQAYEVLSDENKRREYDNPLPNMFGGGMPPGGMPGGFPFNFSDLHNIFKTNIKKKVDHYYNLKISLYDVYFGLKKTLNIKHDIKCEKCNKKCSKCNGTGKVSQRLNMGMMQIIQEQPCLDCNGYGIIKENIICEDCGSTGVKIKKNTIEITVPKGVEDGKQIVFNGLGEQPKNENETAGDFVVTIKIDNGVLFKRDGMDLIYETNLSFKESVVGKTVTIPHFSKEFHLSTTEFGVIDPRKKYLVPGKGLQNDKGFHGNLYIQFNVNYSKKYVFTDNQLDTLNQIL